MMKHCNLFLIAVFLAAGFMACKKKTAPAATRTFYMGTTAWPADFTINEVDTAYKFINDH